MYIRLYGSRDVIIARAQPPLSAHYTFLFYNYCFTVSPQEGDVNLNGARVEVFVSGKWGTISSNTWTIANSQVLCRQLGYKVFGTRKS